MIRSSFVALLFTCVICSFCGQDFVTLGRHSWRCKERINHAEQDNPSTTTSQMPVMQSPNVVLSKRTVIKALIIWTGLARLHGLTRLSETNYFHNYIGIELTRLAGLKTGGFRGKILRESLKL